MNMIYKASNIYSDFFFVCRFIDVLDQIDTRVEKLRKEALQLQERRDALLMSMDVLKNNELMNGLNECKSFDCPC